MKIYEFSLKTTLVKEGHTSVCSSPKEVIDSMEGAFEDESVEHFFVLLLNTKNRLMGRHLVSKGTATASLVHPREVFRLAVMQSATSIICVHNHPSGDPSPSRADHAITNQLKEAGKILGIQVLDHIILGCKDYDPTGLGYYSFSQSGIL
jgi:DNA repair protein RadC